VEIVSVHRNFDTLPEGHSESRQRASVFPQSPLRALGLLGYVFALQASSHRYSYRGFNELCIREATFGFGYPYQSRAGIDLWYDFASLYIGAVIMSPQQNDVPGPIGLLSIQAGGGLLALIPIVNLNGFAKLDSWLYAGLVIGACLNIAASVFMLWAYQQQRSFIARLKPLMLCRLVIFGDTIMLGLLVWGTGGSEKSIFTPQFAAVVPMAMLIATPQS
jgi:hypothetical protein